MFNKNQINYILLLSLLLLSTTSFAAKIVEEQGLYAPEDVAFFDENGEKHFLTEFDSKTILLTFWATWCAACIKEMPELDMLQKDFRKLPFEIIAVSQDFQGISVLKEYFKKNNIKYLKIYHDYRNQLFNECAIVGLPTSLLIDQNGGIVLKFNGAVDWYADEIRQMILSHIPGDHSVPRNSYKPPSVHQVIKQASEKPVTGTKKLVPEENAAETKEDPATSATENKQPENKDDNELPKK